MAKTLQFRRGTTTELSTIAGAVGELFVDTTKDTVVVMDGSTAGGFPLAKESDITAKANASDVTTALAGKANASDVTTALAGKASTSDLTTGLAGKASTSDLTTGLAGKQATLVSGTNIKTVNGTSILGSGNISISGGSGGGDLTQVASDITPSFDSVYDLGSANNRFYDAYLGNKLDINDATLSGTTTLVSPAIAAVPESSTTNTVPVSLTFTIPQGMSYQTGTYVYVNNAEFSNWVSVGWPQKQQELIGATVTLTSLAFGSRTTTITSVPSISELNVADSFQYDNNIVYLTISYQSVSTVTIPAVAAVDAVYDRTLASNATLVAPSLAVDTSLIGGLFTEGTTVTPEHILGAYTDAKGTLVVDGSLKVNDDLSVRNSITLQQDTVSLGTIVSKDTSTSLVNVDIATLYQPNTWYAAFGAYLLVDYDGRLQSSYGNFMSYPGFAGLTSGAVITINLVETGYTWTYTVTSVSHDGMYTNINYAPLSSTSPWSTIYAFNQATIGYSKGFGSGPMYGGYEAGMSSSASVTTTVLALDKLSTPLTSGIKLAINDDFASAPVNQSLSVTGSLSSNNIQNQGGSGLTRELYTNGESWANLTTQSLINTKAIFTTGNQVSITYNGQTGVYSVGATTIAASGYGSNTYYSFVLSYVSGYDFVQNGGIDYAFGFMMQPINWSANVALSTNYTTEYAPSLIASTTNSNKYISTSSTFDWLNVGDTLSYVPATTSIEFKKDDGTLVKAITYNNSTGAITYDGIVQTLRINAAGDISTSDAGAFTPSTAANFQSISIGRGAVANTAGGYTKSIAIGKDSTAGGNGVAIGGTASQSSEAVTVGGNSTGYGAVTVGNNASAHGFGGVAIGYNSIADFSQGTALGTNLRVAVPYSSARNSNGSINKSSCTFETHVFNQNINVGANSSYYPAFGNGSTSASTTIRAQDVLGWYNNTMALATSVILIKDVSTQTRWKAIRLEYIVNSTAAYTFAITNITNTTIGSGSDSAFASAFSAGIEIYSNEYIASKVINGSGTAYTIGVDIKTTYQILTTN